MFVHTKKRSFKKTLLVVVILLFGFIMAASAAGYKLYITALEAPTSTDDSKQLVVSSGESVDTLATKLKTAGLIKSEIAFKLYMRIKRKTALLKAGTFNLHSNYSVGKLVGTLIDGKEESHNYTIAPGLRVDQIKKRMVKSGYSRTDIDAAFEPSNYRDISIVYSLPQSANGLEGYIFPETYSITSSSTPSDIVRVALTQLNKVFDETTLSKLSARGLSPYQAITLASIVEKEVSSVSDRKKVAQIFLSRLNIGMPLGSDATYYYASAVFGGEPFPDLDSPYNTRKYSGLPPGPIDNFSLSSLDAVINPEDSNYLFFVTGDDGVNHFTSTDAEHAQAVKQYCQISCASGYVPTIE